MRSDNELIEKYLQEYLFSNDTLIVNDLGKFDAKYIGANINANVNHIAPPNREIFFNSTYKDTSNSLIDYMAERENRSSQDIENIIKQFVTTLKIEIGIQRKYQIEGFGTFFLTTDNDLKFRQDENINFYAQAYGLPNLFYKPLVTKESEIVANTTTTNPKPTEKITLAGTEIDLGLEDEETETSSENEEPKTEVKSDNGLFIGVLATLFVVTAFFLFAIFSGIDSINPSNWFSGNKSNGVGVSVKPEPDETAKNQEENKPKEEEKNTKEEKSAENNKNIASETTPKEVEKPTPPERTPTPPVVTNTTPTVPVVASSTDIGLKRWLGNYSNNTAPPTTEGTIVKEAKSRYYVVLGSFTNQDNAYSLYHTLLSKGYTSIKVIEAGDGRFRVSYEDFDNQPDALDQAKQMKKRFGVNAWLHKH